MSGLRKPINVEDESFTSALKQLAVHLRGSIKMEEMRFCEYYGRVRSCGLEELSFILFGIKWETKISSDSKYRFPYFTLYDLELVSHPVASDRF